MNELVKRDIGESSGLNGLLENPEVKHRQLRATVARHDDKLAETGRWNSELGAACSSCRERIVGFENRAKG
jgi:hypothetical protein